MSLTIVLKYFCKVCIHYLIVDSSIWCKMGKIEIELVLRSGIFRFRVSVIQERVVEKAEVLRSKGLTRMNRFHSTSGAD